MSESPATTLLQAARSGDARAADVLFARVYDELARIASSQLRRERSDHTLNTSALVHEAYLALIDQDAERLQDRRHFYALAAKAMRQVLIHHARRRNAIKRGGDFQRVTLDDNRVGADADEQAITLLSLDAALVHLEARDPQLAALVEQRFFAGMTAEESAEALGVSRASAFRMWKKAKAYLRELLDAGAAAVESGR
jgi:RNA polymerase sigma factor (TIGR02999 family)